MPSFLHDDGPPLVPNAHPSRRPRRRRDARRTTRRAHDHAIAPSDGNNSAAPLARRRRDETTSTTSRGRRASVVADATASLAARKASEERLASGKTRGSPVRGSSVRSFVRCATDVFFLRSSYSSSSVSRGRPPRAFHSPPDGRFSSRALPNPLHPFRRHRADPSTVSASRRRASSSRRIFSNRPRTSSSLSLCRARAPCDPRPDRVRRPDQTRASLCRRVRSFGSDAGETAVYVHVSPI